MSANTMSVKCPACGSHHITTKDIGQTYGGAIGTVTGAVGAASRTWLGAETGAAIGSMAGPAGTLIGSIAGAILGGLVGGSAGHAIGGSVGKAIDLNILDNYECNQCGNTFSLTPLA